MAALCAREAVSEVPPHISLTGTQKSCGLHAQTWQQSRLQLLA